MTSRFVLVAVAVVCLAAPAADAEKDDDDVDVQNLVNDPAKLREHIRKQMQKP